MGSAIEMVWTCQEERHRRTGGRCKKLVIKGTRRGRGKLKKYWGEMIIDMIGYDSASRYRGYDLR